MSTAKQDTVDSSWDDHFKTLWTYDRLQQQWGGPNWLPKQYWDSKFQHIPHVLASIDSTDFDYFLLTCLCSFHSSKMSAIKICHDANPRTRKRACTERDVTENSTMLWNNASMPTEIILILTGAKPNTNPDQYKKQKKRGLTRCISRYRARTALSYCVYYYSGYFLVDERRTPIYTHEGVVCQMRPARLLPFGVKQK